MAFKTSIPTDTVPDSPDKLLLELPRRTIPDVLPHQQEVMRNYADLPADVSDVALQLPTGSGKTLVGLLTGEWLRRKNHERIVYLCPTKQLVNQVVEQAEEKYGLTVLGFTGSARDYSPTSKAEYRNADRVAVTTYSSLFNTNPFFNDADVILVDDAHAAEGYIAQLWSLRIERDKDAHKTLHAAFRNILKPLLDPVNFSRLSGKSGSITDKVWVDKIPTPVFADVRTEVSAVLDEHVVDTELSYPWSLIREHLHACHLYLSPNEILLRPLISPTWTHAPFANARQRIYMSATLGAGGDLERLMGRRSIRRLPVPEGWGRQGVGRRFFIFPGMALNEEDADELRYDLMRRAGRSLVLVPSDNAREEIAQGVADNLGFKTFDAGAIEDSKKPFISEKEAVAIVANRYDGIDFPGKECRLLLIEGLPKATNLQERFLMARMGANILFNERVQARVLQAIGRCTRSLEDFSAVVVSGEELPDYLSDIKRRKYLHPELQAELTFGVDQSKGASREDLVENFGIFFDNKKEWEDVNKQIVAERQKATQIPFPAIDELRAVVGWEVEFQERLWQGDYEAALDCAERVLGKLTLPALRGYRAIWDYLAGSAAWLGATNGVASLDAKARAHFGQAKEAANGIPWLVALARYQPGGAEAVANNTVLLGQIERVEAALAHLGIVHDRAFAKCERQILDGLQSTEKGLFEQAHKLLGEMIGFDAGKEESDGSPDPWWIAGQICLVFEDHAGAQVGSALDVSKARQTASHPNWMRANVEAAANADITPVLVTPVSTVREGAVPHLGGVALWPLNEFQKWAENALTTLRELRKTFTEPGDLVWRAAAAELFEQRGLDAPSLVAMLKARPAAQYLTTLK
ncbi:MAG: DEAD/DEAH box helicase [Acidiferrobacter sp.]